MTRHFLYLVFGLSTVTYGSADTLLLKKNLAAEWLVFSEGSYLPFESSSKAHPVLYFHLPVNVYRGDYLCIESANPITVFVNNQLLFDSRQSIAVHIDSLAHLTNGKALWVAIHSKKGITALTLATWVGSPVPFIQSDGVVHKAGKTDDFRNFVVVIVLVLLGTFTFLVRLNPVLANHYFSFFRLLSLRESDDTHSLNRMTNSAAIVFHMFAALLTAYVVVIGYDDSFSSLLTDQPQTRVDFTGLVLRWGQVGIIILLIFFTKALLIKIFSSLFGVNDLSGFQFANFMRVVLLTMMVMAVIGTVNLLIGTNQHTLPPFFYPAVKWCVFGWLILVYLKLLKRAPFTPFHLFSYICATEIIPLIIAVNILYE